MRSWLFSAAVTLPLALASCQAAPPTITPAPADQSADQPAGPTVDPDAETLTVDVTNSELAVGEERIAFRLYDSSGQEIVGNTHDVQLRVLRVDPQTGASVPVASGEALFFGLDAPDGGSWVVYTEFDASGPWAVEVNASRADGWSGTALKDVQVAGRTLTPRVGERPPEGDTPVAGGDDLASITSDESPDPDLYGLTVTEAATNGRPTVVHFGSPAHCPTPICSVTLDEVKAIKSELGSRVDFVHVETRDLADPARLSPTTEAWGLPSEPWTFVLDARGRVAARVEGPMDRIELRLLVERELGE
jgi:hypothetical protein